MKTILTIMLISIMILVFIANKNVLTTPYKYYLSYSEFKTMIERAKQKDIKAINTLFRYYATFKQDRKSMWLIICYGNKIGISHYITRMKEQEEIYFNCPQKPLRN